MSGQTSGNFLYRIYRDRIGEPTTHDEVRGYWIFLTGLALSLIGIALFLLSESAAGASEFTLRELSIFVAAVGLAMLVAGPIIRLPLRRWANYGAYLGQLVAFLAAVWFLIVFPQDWSVATGNQPVIMVYGAGILIITVGGLIAPVLAGARREDLEASQAMASALEDELERARETTRSVRGDFEAQLNALHDSQGRFEVFQDRGDEWRWRLRHRNGNVIADSGEGYTRKHNANKGLQSVRRNALGATILLIEPEEELPEEGDSFEPVDARPSQATFEVFADQRGEHRFRLRHDNGNILADGGEGYDSASNARRAIERLRETVGPANYLRFDPTGFEVYLDAAGEWRWRLVHRNGNILADSGQGYSRRHDANRAVARIRDGIDDLEFEVYADQGDEFRWRLLASNDRILADSGEGYRDRTEAEAAVRRIHEYAPDADILEIGQATFEIYEDRDGEHRWRLRHRNGNILLDSGEGYADRTRARESIEGIKLNAPTAGLETVSE